MKALYAAGSFILILATGCFRIEEEPIIVINPVAEISTHIRNNRVFATSQISVNPQIISAGNIPIYYEYQGELAIYNTRNGTIINVIAFSGGGLSKYYTVSADTTGHERFIVIAEGWIRAWTDIGGDSDAANDRVLAEGEFHEEAEIIMADL
jgi:hypothetical protein